MFPKYLPAFLLFVTGLLHWFAFNSTSLSPHHFIGMNFGAAPSQQIQRHMIIRVYDSTMNKSVVNLNQLVGCQKEIQRAGAYPTNANVEQLSDALKRQVWVDPFRMVEQMYQVDVPDSPPTPMDPSGPAPPKINRLQPARLSIAIFETHYDIDRKALTGERLVFFETEF